MSTICPSKSRAHAQLVGCGAVANKAMHGHAWQPGPSTLVVGIRSSLQGCPWLSKIVQVYNLHGIWIARHLARRWQSKLFGRPSHRVDSVYYTGNTTCTLQGTNISHLRKRKIIFRSALVGNMSVPRPGGVPLICTFAPQSLISQQFSWQTLERKPDNLRTVAATPSMAMQDVRVGIPSMRWETREPFDDDVSPSEPVLPPIAWVDG